LPLTKDRKANKQYPHYICSIYGVAKCLARNSIIPFGSSASLKFPVRSGLPLFKNARDSVNLKLLKTKTFACGAVALYYEPAKK